ncbi:Hypothetical predicted protein [Mytilus galloprovincialis]|uniref:Endonuclease/exonuclease/phosphatase domain-containing protein n=1 Tax=Mytilus galloprovincialis TaxID=29158 RepID=A0A8B6HA15_MYTGA|nr:Hypothetical predicted protein [Mytilus galloprovincialis]
MINNGQVLNAPHHNTSKIEICPESDTNSDTTVNLNVNVCENNKPTILKDYEICIGCGKDKTHSKTDWIECNTCRCWWHCSCADLSRKKTGDILIVDNIKEPEKCKTSTDIRKEISKKEKGSNIIQFSYKLPLGGIALHFPSSEEKKKFKERDAKEVFGEDSVAHYPASHYHKQNIIGFAKNIPLNLNLDKLKSEIEYQTGGNISEICRLHFWDTKRPMKVVKIFFDSPSDLDKSLDIEIANVSNNITQKIKVEKKRNIKFIRCYNCQCLGHPANQCQDKNIVTTVDQIPAQKLSVQSQLPVETVNKIINRHRLTVQPSFALSTNINLKTVSNHIYIFNMKILFLNTQSFKTATGLKEICEKYNVDILCINESFESEKNPLSFGDWKPITSPRPNKARGGSAIFLKPSNHFIGQRQEHLELKDIEMVSIEVKDSKNKTFHLWVPYIPPEKPELMKKLCTHIEQQNLNNLILVGDLNAKSFEWNNAVENKHGELLEQCMTTSKLICVNDDQATGYKKSKQLFNDVKNCVTLTHEKVQSDHIAVLLDFNAGNPHEENTSEEEYWNIKKCDWNAWKETAKDSFSKLSFPQNENIENNYNRFEETLTNCMTKCIPLVKPKKKTIIQHPPWWNDDIREMKGKLNKAQKKFKLRSTPENFENVAKAENDFEMTKKDAQNKWSEDLCEKIGEAKSLREKWSNFKKLTKKKSENLVHPLQGNNGNILFTESEKSNILKNTFFEGYHLKANNFNQQFYDDITQQYISISTSNQEENTDNIKYNDYITMEELEGSIFKLKKESAPGPDFFFTELFINGGSELKSKLLDIINQSWEEGIYTIKLEKSKCQIYKKNYINQITIYHHLTDLSA